MQVKVCGLRDVENIKGVASLPIDYIGLIFYEKSPRYVDHALDLKLDDTIKKVGVFVDASVDFIKQKIEGYQLDFVQLHGKESVEFCVSISKLYGVGVIKAISIASLEDVKLADIYDGKVDLLLFDTKVPNHGGSGIKFDWSIIQHYHGNTPFLLSGGISYQDIEAVRKINHPQFRGVDLNSKFEISPAYKDVDQLRDFIAAIK